jgi:hypothetical protein
MNSKMLVFIIFYLFLFSCDKAEDCPEASTGPPYFFVEIVDSATNENVFTNGTYTENQLSVSTYPLTSSFSYSFLSENNENLISITPSWTEGVFKTTLKLDNQAVIPLTTYIVKRESRCHTNYFIENLVIDGFEYQIDVETGIYKIKI